MLQPRPVRSSHRLGASAPGLHWSILAAVVLLLAGALVLSMLPEFAGVGLGEAAAWISFLAALTVLWAGGVRSLAMWLRPGRETPMLRRRPPEPSPASRVALLYCTADDFEAATLRASMAQNRPVDTVILDDSSRAESRAAIDSFARSTGALVVRRGERTGHKAGNINHAMRNLADRYDYVAVLDSDSVLPSDFVSRALAVFSTRPSAGIVQSRVEARSGETRFTEALSGLLGTHIRVTQAARSEVGFSHFLGRGALVSTECFRATRGVPELVMEDVAFTVAARQAGFDVVYAPGLVTVEDYPVDYAAFRTQYRKMIEGATEFLLQAGRRVSGPGLRWWERLDLMWEQLHAPVASLAGLVAVLAGVLLASDGTPAMLPVWAAAVTSLLVAAPLLPEAARLVSSDGLIRAARFLALATVLYGSTMILAIRATGRVLLRRPAEFLITPKRPAGGGPKVFRLLGAEVVTAVTAASVSLALTGTLLPVVPLLVPASAGIFLLVWGGRPELGREQAASSISAA